MRREHYIHLPWGAYAAIQRGVLVRAAHATALALVLGYLPLQSGCTDRQADTSQQQPKQEKDRITEAFCKDVLTEENYLSGYENVDVTMEEVEECRILLNHGRLMLREHRRDKAGRKAPKGSPRRKMEENTPPRAPRPNVSADDIQRGLKTGRPGR